ncbi:MAG TPA: bifunctional diguanylate cyclase/phosphodiesterase [Acidimicrobiales bacterium]|nr:bifunctional diguanylate cyclase/phosphodiesterase [Acidimicrobiales bacterium]
MDATNALEHGTLTPAELPLLAETPAEHDTAHPKQPHRWRFAACVYTYSALIGLLAAGLCLVGPLHGLTPIRLLLPQAAMFGIVTALYVVVDRVPVELPFRGTTYALLLTQVPLLFGLAFLSPNILVLASICSSVIAFAILRRQHPTKVVYNVAAYAFATALAATLFRELLGTRSPVSLLGWAAAAVAVMAHEVSTSLTLRGITLLSGQRAKQRTGNILMAILAMFTAAGLCLALGFVDAAWLNPWTTLPLVVVAGLIIVAFKGYARLRIRFLSLQHLYDFSQSMSTANLEPSSMSVDVLKEVCTVLRARRAEMILAEPSGIPRRITFDDGGPSGIEPINLDDSSFVTQAITTGKASLHNSATQDGTESVDPVAGDYQDAMVAPLMNQHTAIGAIIAIDRDEELDSFDEDDLRLFETLVAHASTSLERARLVEELRYEVDSKSHQATHDMLTGLPNRILFLTRAAAALNESGGVAIVLLDIDRFKDVNDTLGHAIGDRLLCEIAERLLRAVSGRATVARLGGDEFALVISDVADSERAIEIVHELNVEMQRPIKMDGLTLAVTASAGVAMAPAHGDDVALLLQRADIAMYLAKERRSTVEVYSVEHDQSMQRWLMLGGLLTHALEAGTELSLMYQPIGDVQSREIAYVEALCRWNHPVEGFIPPEEFIGIAEQMGLIPQITDFVLNEGCAQLARWREAGITIGLAVNVSGREFADINLVDRVETFLRRYDIPAHLLTLEVTETEIMADLGAATKVLYELSARGIKLGIDDYGTGYSSLQYLHTLPVNELKIDRSFVTNLPNEASNRIIVRSSIQMAHSLGLYVIAEGAEDELTCAILAEAECDFIQGYYLSKPQKADDLQDWILGGAKLEFAPVKKIPGAEGAALMLMSKSG